MTIRKLEIEKSTSGRSTRRTETALTLGEVNRELRKRGIKDKLVKGNGYYYFVGDASNWPDNSVHVYNISDLTIEQVVDDYNRLKDEADPDLQARLLEQRYGKKKAIGQNLEVATNTNLDFKAMPKWGLNGTYTEVFADKPVAREFADYLVNLKCTVETAILGGKFYVCWTGKSVDTQAWRKERLKRKGVIK